MAWLVVVLEPQDFFRELHRVQSLSSVYPSGAGPSSQDLLIRLDGWVVGRPGRRRGVG